MAKQLCFEEVTISNLNAALSVQKQIFPDEDATQNFMDAIYGIDHESEKDKPYYIPNCQPHYHWIVKHDSNPVGIVGLYSYLPYPGEAWLGWFGILPRYRGNGFARQAFEFWLDMSRKSGAKTARIYTSESDNAEAIRFYQKMGMEMEKYYNPDDVHEFMDSAVIFSKSLTDGPAQPWNNKYLFLGKQEVKQKMTQS